MRAIVIAIILIISLGSYAQTKPRLPAPPGTAYLIDSTFIFKTETSNIHWIEYLTHIKRDSSNEFYVSALPDTSVWDNWDTTGRFKDHYLRYAAARQYPVVGISFHQALDYCEWLTKIVNQNIKTGFYNKDYLKGFDPQKIRFSYRLPTEEEMIHAINISFDKERYPENFQDSLQAVSLEFSDSYYLENMKEPVLDTLEFKKELNLFRRNGKESAFNCQKDFGNYFTYGDYTTLAPIEFKTGKKANSDKRLHHILGNVAEMIAQEGVAMGGAFIHSCKECNATVRNLYTGPAFWLGFRPVVDIYLLDN